MPKGRKTIYYGDYTDATINPCGRIFVGDTRTIEAKNTMHKKFCEACRMCETEPMELYTKIERNTRQIVHDNMRPIKNAVLDYT